ncbi:hypothetical protein BDN72DRAFT_859246 [Pluteus cervinus]|uniref:Uncharacterized protein n=1 Tax=Pluteus cervinus TaxID=181527 RepID=A0ACD3AN24_9AGAR|nr:hypothetical protein BDN72DRAFT_859246 [Pluteus cervinus]
MSRPSRIWALQSRSASGPTGDSGANYDGTAPVDTKEVPATSPTSLTVTTNLDSHRGHMRTRTFTGTIDSNATTLDGNNATNADNHHLSSSTIVTTVPKSPFSTQTIRSACSTEGFFYPPLSPSTKTKLTSGNPTSPPGTPTSNSNPNNAAANEKRGFFHYRSRTRSQVKADDVLQDVHTRPVSKLLSATIHPYQLAAYTSPLVEEESSGGVGGGYNSNLSAAAPRASYERTKHSPRLKPIATSSEPSEGHSEKSPPLTGQPLLPRHQHLSPKQRLDVPLPSRLDQRQGLLPDQPDTPTSPSFSPNFLTQARTFVLLFLLLGLPPLLSALYLVTGHAIFQRSSPAYRHPIVPLASSARAGAVGGIILAIPLALVLYLSVNPAWLSLAKLPSLLSRKTAWSNEPQPEDFFEDDGMSEVAKETYWVWSAIVILVSVVLGTASGPLGVTCLTPDGGPSSVPMYLGVGHASVAGLVGAAVVFGAVLVLGIIVMLVIVHNDRVERERETRMNGPAVSTS